MPELTKDKKELATNRLLEVLRGDTAEEETSIAEEKLALSEEEQTALSRQVTAGGTSKIPSSEPEKRLSVRSLIDTVQSRVQSILKPQKGAIGIDIGSDSVKYVCFIEEKHGYTLKDIGIRKIEEHYTGDPRKKIENLKNAISDLVPEDFKKRYKITTTVFGQNVSIKKISLPKLPKKELKDAVLWNAKKDLSFSGEDATCDYKILGKVEDQGIEKTEVLVAVVENKLINEQVHFFNSLSVDLSKILAIPLSIYSNFLHFSDNPEKENGVVIDIGSKMTNIIFINEGNLQFAREISTGGKDITEGMVGTLSGTDGVVKINKEEAERLKFVYGIPLDDPVQTTENGISLNHIASVMRPTLERMLVQIQRSFDFYRTKFPYEEPEKVYLTGGTALLKNIDVFLADGLNKDVEVMNPFKGVYVDRILEEEKNVSEVAPSLAVAAGVVFSNDKGINLLPQELKDKLLFAVQKKILTAAASVIFLILSVMSIFSFSDFNSVGDQLSRLRVDKQPSDMMQAQHMQYTAQISQLTNEHRAEQNNFEAFAGTIQIVDYLKLLSMITPDYITLESVSVDLNQSNVLNVIGKIYVDISEAEFYLSHYLKQLDKSGMFVRVNPYTIVNADELGIASDGTTEFLAFEMVCNLPLTTHLN